MGSGNLSIPEIRYDNFMEPIRSSNPAPKLDMSPQLVQQRREKILVIRNMGMGDVIMALVAIRALRKHHPKARIRFACNREYVDLVSETPYIDQVVSIDAIKVDPDEQVIDLRMAVEPGEIGGKISKEYYDRKNRIDIFLDTVGMTGEDQKLELFLRKSDVFWAIGQTRSWPTEGRKLLAIQPFCTSLYRSWPEEHFRKFVEAIDKEKYMVVILGEKCPWSWASYELEGDGIINLLGKTTPAQVCAMVGQMDVFVGIDSGLIHAAAAMGVTSIALFGAIAPDLRLRYYPTVTPVTSPRRLPCGPCGDVGANTHPDCPPPRDVRKFSEKRTVGAPCMKEILPENVMALVNLDEKRCLLCDGRTTVLGCKNGHVLLRCLSCSLVFSDRWAVSEVHSIYAGDTYWKNEAHVTRESVANNRTRVNRLNKHADLAGKRIFDAGCGQGGFVRYLRGQGFEAEGIDWAVRHPEKYFQVKSIFDEERIFDIVSCIEVIEHIYDPQVLFRKLSSIVAPGGLLYLETSDTQKALRHEGLGLGNAWFDPPVHCLSYDRKSAELALNLYGFELLEDFSKDLKDFSLILLARKI